ncbi:hypothetical protein AXX17_AT2G05060 [Arabidopsis thaliana]|uniref:Uncharacterized protein n=1 Tax=Arabidopsis thaliana TaxID=3702 RepID=A0A178VWK7_ARATH|nr:hypothetical protein AXX17_AT2G05060 [Arabidopsis thaliana]
MSEDNYRKQFKGLRRQPFRPPKIMFAGFSIRIRSGCAVSLAVRGIRLSLRCSITVFILSGFNFH